MKPFGDRLIYHKKRLWDYDSAVVAEVLDLPENPEDMSIGLEHSKLSFLTPDDIKKKLDQNAAAMSQGKDILLIEGGKNLTYGTSVHLDAISLARYLDCPLVTVIGAEGEAIDDISFARKYVDLTGIDFKGLIINKAHEVEDYKNTHLKAIADMDLTVLGIIPAHPELTHLSVQYLSDRLFAKVIAGERGLNGVVKNIFVGAMSANAALRSPKFHKERKMIITAGDRVDMILAAMESDTSCIILTNNILPPSNIISMATDRDIPVLLVATDTYQVAQQVDNMEALLTRHDSEKIALLGRLVKEHVAVDNLLKA